MIKITKCKGKASYSSNIELFLKFSNLNKLFFHKEKFHIHEFNTKY